MAYPNIIGREEEIKKLEKFLKSTKSEFVAIYGRRRVGKSYLVEEVYKDKIVFRAVGAYIKEKYERTYKQVQLDHFYESLLDCGVSEDTPRPSNWREAFRLLRKYLEGLRSRRRVVFLDELPWLAGPQSSELITELGYFWNSWADRQRNIVLVVCGSATSWMLDNVIRDYGGLHGRLTEKIRLLPFTLKECEQYFKKHGFRLSRYEIAVAYMAFGGIPYYLNYLQPNRSLAQNIDSLFFSKSGKLRKEFSKLYKSLFSDSDKYMQIVRTLAAKRDGLTRKEIAEKTGIAYNGRLTKMLKTLVLSDFVVSYIYYGGSAKEVYYKLVDSFSLFYLVFIDNQPNVRENFWTTNLRTPQLNTWRGLAFEDVCMTHIRQIKKALGFSAVESTSSPWRSKERKAQIDLLFDRADRVVCVCEMKFSSSEFSVDKEYDAELRRKVDRFAEETRCRKSIQLALVTTYGLTRNSYSGQFHSAITMDALFEKEA